MATCKYCGADLKEGFAFCQICGKPVEKYTVCPNCGKEVPREYAFCPYCGISSSFVNLPANDVDVKESSYAGNVPATISNALTAKKRSKKAVVAISIFAVIAVVAIYLLLIRINFHRVLDRVGAYEDGRYFTVASDGGYLKVDTNPNDISEGDSLYAASVIVELNKKLGVSEAITEKMNDTRAIDGRQNAETLRLRISWTYHPTQGLQIIYEKKWGF